MDSCLSSCTDDAQTFDVEPLSMAFSALGAAKRAYDDKKLREQITLIEHAVAALGEQIHEILLIDVRAAYRHLETAGMAANDSVRREEFMLARGVFARLVEHPVAAV